MAIRAFTDPGYSEQEFTRFFFEGPDFRIETLRDLAAINGPSSGSKESLALRLTEQIKDGSLEASVVWQALAGQTRGWLALRVGSIEQTPRLRDTEPLLSSFGESGWYGPISSINSEGATYIRVFAHPHYLKVGGTFLKARIRWLLFACANPEGLITYHWDGFSFREEKLNTTRQFKFWQHIGLAMQRLEESLGSNFTNPNLRETILHTLWNRYIDDSDYTWQHLRIRAEASGVALNARSAGVSEVDVAGLQALTTALARSVISQIPQPQNLNPDEIERILLQTIIHEWGPNSYEFALQQEKAEEPLIKTHVYFGERPGDSQDALQHLKCYIANGGSAAVARFLRKWLEMGSK